MAKESVIQGVVTKGGAPVPAAYVRLLDSSAEFTAEVQTSATGQFRFFAAPGEWTLRVLSVQGNTDARVTVTQGEVTDTAVTLP